MHPQSLRAVVYTFALAALTVLTAGDPPTGERALLGWTPRPEVGGSNLRLAGTHGQVGGERALLGRLTGAEAGAGPDEAIRIRPHPIDGTHALLGRP